MSEVGKQIIGGMNEALAWVKGDKEAVRVVYADGREVKDEMTNADLTDDEHTAVEGLRAAIALAHQTATDVGWYVNPHTGETIARNFGEVVALMHSELSEALEAHRKSLMDDKLPHRSGIEVEFADCIIRIFDTSAALGLDLAGAIIEKNRYNAQRADHKLAARRSAGGKAY